MSRPGEQRGDNELRRGAKRTIALVGPPNVGKSATFNNLTNTYATVSNYPGTTVEVTRGRGHADIDEATVIDTPGLYSLSTITEEERVARSILLQERPDLVLCIIDARKIERMLPLCLQLMELALPLVLVINMIDDAERAGLEIDTARLSMELGIAVVATASTSGRGIDELKRIIAAPAPLPVTQPLVDYGDRIEAALATIACKIPPPLQAWRSVALLLLLQDDELTERVHETDAQAGQAIDEIVDRCSRATRALSCVISERRQDFSRGLARQCSTSKAQRRKRFTDRLEQALINPLVGLPVALLVLYFGVYKFVGVLGAGTVVDTLQGSVFGEHINPWIDGQLKAALPAAGGWQYWARELVGGEYGVITLGISYALTLVLPLVTMFFLFFSVLEDSGYFPRLALMVDRLFKWVGLNGRAVLPLVVGFGCDTMATLVTRVQESRRERIITTFLLALAVPCSAQHGLIVGLLAKQPTGALGVPTAFLLWCAVLAAAFLAAGLLASRVVPGRSAAFYMEVPTLRLPRPTNVLRKTLARMKAYFFEILPLFVLASLLIWVGRLTGIFDLLLRGLEPLVLLIGLPAAAAEAVLYGFFRRDFGAAGLYKLASAGRLNTRQMLIGGVTLTLFLPCIAQILVMKKERGVRATAVMAVSIIAIAFSVGGLLNLLLRATGVTL